jgi:hypothetical protein
MPALAKIIDLETKMQVYNLFVEGKSQREIRKQFGLSTLDISIICNEILSTKKMIIAKIKADNPNCEIKFLHINDIICASFANLTVGDCVMKDGRIAYLKGE